MHRTEQNEVKFDRLPSMLVGSVHAQYTHTQDVIDHRLEVRGNEDKKGLACNLEVIFQHTITKNLNKGFSFATQRNETRFLEFAIVTYLNQTLCLCINTIKLGFWRRGRGTGMGNSVLVDF